MLEQTEAHRHIVGTFAPLVRVGFIRHNTLARVAIQSELVLVFGLGNIHVRERHTPFSTHVAAYSDGNV